MLEINRQHAAFESVEKSWGYRQPTVLIESQSAPALIGDPAEQAYMRAFVLAGKEDLVVTDFSLDSVYVENYLHQTLGFDLPQFLVTHRNGGSCLSENIISSPLAVSEIKKWIEGKSENTKIQFFNVTPTEKKLQELLGIEATCGDIDYTVALGSKPGFRKICDFLDLPIPKGYICYNLDSTTKGVKKLFQEGKQALIKSQFGTGGTDLKSNVVVSQEEFEKSGDRFEDYVLKKIWELGDVIGSEWVVEEKVEGEDGSVHVYIKDRDHAEEPFILGALSENNSYIGGYYPFEANSHYGSMIDSVKGKIVPFLQQHGIFGYHCFDFKNHYFLEDNARQGALDFVHGITKRIAEIHFKGDEYAYWHCHVALKKATTFPEVFMRLKTLMDPKVSSGCFLIVTNPEVLPFGRSLDVTAVNYGSGSSVDTARGYFEDMKQVIWDVL